MLALRAAAAVALAAGCAGTADAHAAWARVTLRCADGSAEVLLDGAPAGRVEDYAGKRLSVRPGRHRIEIRSGGSVETREMELGPEDDVALAITLPARAEAAAGGTQ